jgi:large repetitive protein
MDNQLSPHGHQVAFVFDNVSNYQQLVSAFGSDVEVHVLDAGQDGMAQMAAILAGRSGIESLHIVGHGAQAALDLGSVTLDIANIGAYAGVLGQIGSSLAADADLLLYGCDVGTDAAGQAFIGELARLTGADVAASSNLTGSASAGGDWVLEQSTGHIESAVLAAPDYKYLLASGTLTFSGALPANTSTVTDGLGGSTDISGITLQISSVMHDPSHAFSTGDYAWTFENPYSDGATVIVPGYGFNIPQTSITIKSSSTATDFSFKSIFIVDNGGPFGSSLKIEGFNNGSSTGFVLVDPTGGNSEHTFGTSDLTASKFNDVDEVRISHADGSDMWIGINNIQIGDAILPAPTVTDAYISITSTGTGTGGAYKIGDTITAKWDNTSTGQNQSDITGVTMDFGAFGGSSVTASHDINGNWTASYTVIAGITDATNRNVSVTATSSGGYTVGNDTTNLTVDNVAPNVTDARISISGASGTGGAFKVGDTVTATWNNTAGGDNNSDTVSGVKVDFSQFGGGSAVTAVNSSGTWTATYTIVSGAINGTTGRNVSVTVTDNAGNTTTVADTTNATVDNAAPSTTISAITLSNDTGTSNTDFITSNPSQTIGATLSGALAAGDILYGSLDNGSTWTDITSKVSGTTLAWNGVTLSASGTLKLKVVDAAGNNGAVSSQAYVLDTSAPSAPSAPDMSSGTDSGSSSSDNVTNNTAPTFSGTAESGSTVKLYDTDGTTVLGTATATGGNWSITSSTLASGSHDITAKATDAAGNTSAASGVLQAIIDTTAPTGTALSTTTVVSSTASSNATIATLSATDSQAITYSLATGNGTNDANNGSFSISGTSLKVGGSSLTAGTYKIYVAATDAAGNVANQAFTVTLVDAPSVTSIVRAGGASAMVAGSASSLQYTVTFSQSVTGVDASDFALTATGTASGNIASVSGSGTTYTVTVDSISGDGTIRLDLNSAGTGIQNGSSVGIAAGYTSGSTYTLDHTAPAAPTTPDLTSATDTGTSSSDNLTKNTAPSFSGTAETGSTVTLYDTDGSTVLGTTTATGGSWSITSSALPAGTHQVAAKATDAAGNTSALSSALAVTIDTAAPTGTALSATTIVTSHATSTSAIATLSATDSQAITYTLAAGNGTNDADNGSFTIAGTSLKVGSSSLTAGTYKIYVAATDAAGNVSNQPFTITLVDAPSVSSVSVPAAGTHYIGENLDFTVSFSQAVVVDTSGGTPRMAITLDTGGTVYADYLSGSGSNALVFRHTVAQGEADANGVTVGAISLQGGTIRDGLSNDANTTLNSVASTALVLVDGTLPHVTGVSAATADGAYKAGSTITIDVSMDRSVTVDTTGGVATLALSSGGTATYSAGSGSSTLSFSYVVGSGQNAADLDASATSALSLNGATLKDAGGGHIDADLTLPVPGAAGSLGANKSLVIDTATPTATLSGLALSSDTGTSATDFVTRTAAQTISATLSAALGASDVLYGSLDNGATWADITAKVSGTSIAWNGVTLGASGTIKLKVSDVAGNDGATISQAYVLDTTAPTNTFASVHLSADTGSSGSDFVTSAVSQTITATLSSALAADDIVYGSLDGGATWLDITAKVSGTSLSWDGALLSGSSGIRLKVTDAAGNDGTTYAQAYVLDTLAPSAAVASAAFSNDSGTSASDLVTNGAAQTISGSLSAVPGAGETVYVSLDNGTTWTAASTSGSTWSLAGQTLSGSGTLKVKLTDLAGNDGAVYSHAYVLDTAAPSITFSNLALSADTGASATDFVTQTAAQTVRATLSAPLAAGDVVYGSLDGGATWTDITAKVSGTALAWDGVTLSGSSSIKLKLGDAAGNSGSVLTQSYVLDTTAPAAPGTPALTVASDSDTVGDGATNLTPVFTGTALANAQVALYDGTTLLGSGVADGTGKWTISPAGLPLGTHTLTARQYDTAGNLSDASAAFTLRVERAPVKADLIDGVAVAVTPVSLPGGQAGTSVVIPLVTADRVESSGVPGVADIPLASSGGAPILTAQVATGFGLSAFGGAIQPAANGAASLLAAIKAASSDHAVDDTSHLTGNGQAFLNKLITTQPLLVETVVPVGVSSSVAGGSLTLNGSSGPGQSVALVIDSSHLPQGSTLQLQNVDFAAVIGAASVTVDNSVQVMTGDAASQHITVATGGTGSLFAGGGNDAFAWGIPKAQNGATVHADVMPGQSVTMLHGGTGTDTVTFNGTRDSFNIALHNGYEVVASKAEPNAKVMLVNVEQLAFSDGTVAVETDAGQATIAGLYMGIYGRQPDLYGFEFWSAANQLFGLSYGAMALSMIDQSEWAKTHDAINGNSSHDVGVLYSALFGRSGDAAGVAFWVGAMQQHGLSLDQIADYMIKSAEMNVHQRPATEWDFLV